MAVGAFMAYNAMLRIPHMPILGAFIIGGLCAAAVGLVFGLPSLRIKGLYLAVATLACQFSCSGRSTASAVLELQLLGRDHGAAHGNPGLCHRHAGEQVRLDAGRRDLHGARGKNLMRSEPARLHGSARHGRGSERDRHPDDEDKLLAFAISSFYCGVAGALYAFSYLAPSSPKRSCWTSPSACCS